MDDAGSATTFRRSSRLGAARMWAHLCPALTVDVAMATLDDIAAARAAAIRRPVRSGARTAVLSHRWSRHD